MRVVVVGHGAREYAISRRLIAEGCQVYNFLANHNWGIDEISQKSLVHSSYNPDEIVRFAKETRADYIVVGNEEPLFRGLGDLAATKEIPLYGPDQNAARLESDPILSKNLFSECFPESVKNFRVFVDPEQALSFAQNDNRKMVVKLIGPLGEKDIHEIGVRGKKLLRSILSQENVRGRKILIEDFVEGKNFSIHCMSDGENHLFTPAIHDYPFRHEGNKGEKTGGMGSVSAECLPLPFMIQQDYEKACRYIRTFLEYVRDKHEIVFKGMLSAQFYKTSSEILFNEFDVRPGDSEIINILETMTTPFSEILEKTLSGELKDVNFLHVASIVACFVPSYYPKGKVEPQEVKFDSDSIDALNCRIYFGNVKGEQGKLVTGTSRSLALATTSQDLPSARTKVMNAARFIGPNLECRNDIGLF